MIYLLHTCTLLVQTQYAPLPAYSSMSSSAYQQAEDEADKNGLHGKFLFD